VSVPSTKLATSTRGLLSNDSIVTDVEFSSTAPSGGKVTRSVFKPIGLAGVVITLLSYVVIAAPRVAAGDPLASAQAQAAQIAAQLQADSARVDAISQQYEEAQGRVQALDDQINQIRSTIAADQAQVQNDQGNLRQAALNSYMTAGNNTGLEQLFAPGGQSAAVANTYRTVASGNISTDIDALNVAQKNLAAQQAQLQVTQGQAQAALDAVASQRQAAEAAVAQQEATLAQVKGQIAGLVAQQQAAQAAAQHAAFVNRVGSLSNIPPPPGSGAGAAVAAAESQIGVPYQWGGESPGVGFDCSGLTQWAWGRAGVGIPRTAQDQYDASSHIPLGDLAPGDLVFWGGGPGSVEHVGMYVGGGDVVDAPQTGSDVQIQPIWDNGLVGAGRV